MPLFGLSRRRLVTLACLFCSLSFQAFAATPSDNDEIRSRFALLGLRVTDITPAPVEGLMEVTTNQGTFFATPNGDYFLQGKLYSLSKSGQFTDVMAEKYGKEVEKFADDMIVYKAKNEKYVITVFTDITCGYCLKLHKEMKDYNDAGITVRYLAFPRQGANGDVAEAMAKVWCADDRKQALDDVKLNRSFDFDTKNLASCKVKIADQYAFGVKIGITGTPAILLSNGRLVGGYLPAPELLKRLQSENL